MAQKKITDLQLRDNVTAELNFPSDDTIQSYRVTASQVKDYILANQNVLLPMLKDDIFNGLSAVSPADDDYFPLIDTSDSNKTKKGLVGSFRNAVYRSVVTTDSVGLTDETMKLSGASFTSTLPTAVGVAGKRYKFIHAGTNLSQKYTLATTGGQTIGGIASGSYLLCTTGEILVVESDDANWLIVSRQTGAYFSAGTTIVTGATSNPTKGTITTDSMYVQRRGKMARLIIRYNQTAVGGAAGSGAYLWALPTGMLFDSTVPTTGSTIPTIAGAETAGSIPAHVTMRDGTTGPTAAREYVTLAYSTSQFYMALAQIGGIAFYTMGSSAFPLNAAISFTAVLEFPVSDWQP
jgi:hypothetical protein